MKGKLRINEGEAEFDVRLPRCGWSLWDEWQKSIGSTVDNDDWKYVIMREIPSHLENAVEWGED
jgi:hypothetical protein